MKVNGIEWDESELDGKYTLEMIEIDFHSIASWISEIGDDNCPV